MRKGLYHIFILFLLSGMLAAPCIAETGEPSAKPIAAADSGEIAQALSFLHDMTDTDYAEACIPCTVESGTETETMEALCGIISEQLETAFQDEQFQPADYLLDTGISDYPDRSRSNLAMYWDQEEERYVIGCYLQCRDARPSFKLFIQRYGDAYVPDIYELPFGLSYGADEAEIWESLANLPVQYSVFSLDRNGERGCFTVFLPDGGSVEYMQIFTDSFGYMQYYASYAQSGFSFPLEKQLSEVVYHIDSTYTIKKCLDEISPLLDEKWGKDHKETGAGLKDASWSYSHDTEEIMKDEPILSSKFWIDYGMINGPYDSAVLYANDETHRSSLRYDGRRGLILEIVNGWTLIE